MIGICNIHEYPHDRGDACVFWRRIHGSMEGCSDCPMWFSNREAFLQHMRDDHPDKLAPCEYCGGEGCFQCPPRPTDKGVKYDKDKARWDLLPFKATEQVVGVLTYGAKKYAPENWRKVEGWRWRYYGAALRHMVAWWGGQKIDPESGYHHLAHAACCILFALELDL